MAKYQFADKARQDLEAQGAVFDAEGNIARVTETTAVFAGEQDTPAKEATTPPQESDTSTTNDTDYEALLVMQREELEKLRAEKATWEQNKTQAPVQKSERESELEAELAALRQQLNTQTEAQQADEMRALFEAQGFESENFDDDMLLEIRDRMLKPMANKLKYLEDQVAKYGDKLRDPTPEEQLKARKAATLTEVKKVIPDFDTIFNSDKFQEKLGSQDSRFPTGTYGEALQIAYESGNHGFIIQEVKNFLGGNNVPNLAGVADVGATNGVGNTVTEPKADGFTYSDEEARQMLRNRQMGTVSRQEYSEYVSKLNAHRSAQQK